MNIITTKSLTVSLNLKRVDYYTIETKVRFDIDKEPLIWQVKAVFVTGYDNNGDYALVLFEASTELECITWLEAFGKEWNL